MNLYIEYNDESIPPFEQNMPESDSLLAIYELKVEGKAGHSKKVSLEDYIIALKNLYKGVNNTHKTGIKSMVLKDGFFREIGFKDGDFFYLKKDKGIKDVDIYDIVSLEGHDDLLKEGYYFTKNGSKDNSSNLKYEENIVNSEITKTVTLEDISETDFMNENDFFKSYYILLNYYFSNYTFNLVKKDNKIVIEYKYCKNKLEHGIEDIKEDDVFLFFKTVEVLLPYLKNTKRIPIYFFDCENLSANVIKALITFLKLIRYSICEVYLYNISEIKHKNLNGIDCTVIELPNHMKKSVKK